MDRLQTFFTAFQVSAVYFQVAQHLTIEAVRNLWKRMNDHRAEIHFHGSRQLFSNERKAKHVRLPRISMPGLLDNSFDVVSAVAFQIIGHIFIDAIHQIPVRDECMMYFSVFHFNLLVGLKFIKIEDEIQK